MVVNEFRKVRPLEAESILIDDFCLGKFVTKLLAHIGVWIGDIDCDAANLERILSTPCGDECIPVI
jgi:hypothetical protein